MHDNRLYIVLNYLFKFLPVKVSHFIYELIYTIVGYATDFLPFSATWLLTSISFQVSHWISCLAQANYNSKQNNILYTVYNYTAALTINNSKLSQTNPRDALYHSKRVTNKSGCAVWYTCDNGTNSLVMVMCHGNNAKPGIERVQALADISRSALCCHSNETRAPTANPLNSEQPEGTPYHSSKLHLGPCSSMEMREGTDRHTYTDGRDYYIFRLG